MHWYDDESFTFTSDELKAIWHYNGHVKDFLEEAGHYWTESGAADEVCGCQFYGETCATCQLPDGGRIQLYLDFVMSKARKAGILQEEQGYA